jgi:hypothetical protein
VSSILLAGEIQMTLSCKAQLQVTFCYDSEIGDAITLLHGGNRADIKGHASLRRARFIDRLSEIIGDISDLHASFHIGATLDEGIEDVGLFAGSYRYFLDPDRVLSNWRSSGSILR